MIGFLLFGLLVFFSLLVMLVGAIFLIKPFWKVKTRIQAVIIVGAGVFLFIVSSIGAAATVPAVDNPEAKKATPEKKATPDTKKETETKDTSKTKKPPTIPLELDQTEFSVNTAGEEVTISGKTKPGEFIHVNWEKKKDDGEFLLHRKVESKDGRFKFTFETVKDIEEYLVIVSGKGGKPITQKQITVKIKDKGKKVGVEKYKKEVEPLLTETVDAFGHFWKGSDMMVQAGLDDWDESVKGSKEFNKGVDVLYEAEVKIKLLHVPHHPKAKELHKQILKKYKDVNVPIDYLEFSSINVMKERVPIDKKRLKGYKTDFEQLLKEVKALK